MTMFATVLHTTQEPTVDLDALANGVSFPKAQFTSQASPETSYLVYGQYRQLALSLINVDNPEIFYRTYYNAEKSYNGDGVHEKFIYQGQSILDLSVGLLDFPWHAADSNPINEITVAQLQQLAHSETSLIVSPRLNAIANFILHQPTFTRVYYYRGVDGTVAITINDEFNGVKMNCILTYGSEFAVNF